MKELDKLGKLLNLILGILYIPLSLFSWLLQMTSESTLNATNQLYISLIDIFCIIAFLFPLLCIAGILASIFFRKKGHTALSLVAQFLPLAVFFLNLILLVCADLISK